MESNRYIEKILTILTCLVWLINGLLCKVLNLVPRHQEIVQRILKTDDSRLITILIGMSEIAMTIWIITGIKKRWNAIAQITIVLTMNLLEFFIAPDLLLWGRMNIVFALTFTAIIYFKEFRLQEAQLIKN